MPPALFSCTGEMFKTDKSTLAKTLKSQVEMVEPKNINVEIIDGFYFLHLIGSTMPHTFEKIAESILIKLCSSDANEIHLIFDRYLTPSIKDSERQNRQEFDIPFKISGPQQTRPTDFLKSLKNYRFKEALVQFLANYWENDYLRKIINNKKIFVTVEEHCYSYQTQQNRVIKNKENDYECFHEEADTRMVFHAYKAASGSKILIKSADTDVLIILLGNMHKIKNSEIWLATSLSKKRNSNDLNCINCTELASKLGLDLCLGLPAFHAYTGSDYTAAFYNKGKVRPFNLFSKNQTYQKYFASLTDEADVYLQEKMDVIEEFTVAMYGIKNCNKVNDARYQIFVRNFSAKEDNEDFLKKIRNFDSNTIPPCWISLKQKILRTIYVNSMWLHATDPHCAKLNPENCGWFLDGHLKPKGFEGDQTPLKIDDILEMTEKENDDDSSDLENDTTSGDSDPE